jgi:hypothetical protein
MNKEELHKYCLEWVEWCRTRRFYAPPVKRNILERMRNPAGGKEPNGRNDPDMQFFNMAIFTLADMPEYKKMYNCFHFCYIVNGRNAKALASELEISRKTYYNYIDEFARRAQSMARSLKTARAAMDAASEQAVIAD